MTETKPDWYQRARTLAIEGRVFIDGRVVAAAPKVVV
jgi:hypothetical protein